MVRGVIFLILAILILYFVLLPCIGFTASGVAAGSLAAMWQSSIGNVAAGSTFALLQSIGTAGFSAGGVLAILILLCFVGCR